MSGFLVSPKSDPCFLLKKFMKISQSKTSQLSQSSSITKPSDKHLYSRTTLRKNMCRFVQIFKPSNFGFRWSPILVLHWPKVRTLFGKFSLKNDVSQIFKTFLDFLEFQKKFVDFHFSVQELLKNLLNSIWNFLKGISLIKYSSFIIKMNKLPESHKKSKDPSQ